jgi:hypothetical protein
VNASSGASTAAAPAAKATSAPHVVAASSAGSPARSKIARPVEPDGSLTYEVRLRWHGLPVAHLDMRGRVVDTTPAPARATPVPAAS